jgi:putrescine importer
MGSNATPSAAPGLARTLGLWDLVFIGIIMVQPTAPMSGFGAFYDKGHGHVVTAVLIAMVPMLFTAVSYGRLASVYPSAGSAYAYVGQEMHPAAGFASGWGVMLDYLLNPLICVIWCARAMGNLFPAAPYGAWALLFAGLFTWINLRRIRATAHVNAVLTGVMGVVIVWMLGATIHHVAGMPWRGAGFFTRPFYDAQRFSWASLRGGTSLAVLTYLGFEGVTTLSEEARNPRRTILRATVLTCLVTGYWRRCRFTPPNWSGRRAGPSARWKPHS